MSDVSIFAHYRPSFYQQTSQNRKKCDVFIPRLPDSLVTPFEGVVWKLSHVDL